MKVKYLVVIVTLGFFNYAHSKPAASTTLSGWTAGAAIFYPSTGRRFEGVGSRSTNHAVLTTSFEMEAQPSYYGFIKYSAPNSFGFTLGYEALQESSLTGGNVNYAGILNTPAKSYTLLDSFHLNIAHLGTEYRFNEFYIPIQVLIIDPKYKMKPGTLGSKAAIGTGYSVGGGFHLLRNLSVELNYRSIGFEFGEFLATGNNPPTDDYGKIISNEIILGLFLHI